MQGLAMSAFNLAQRIYIDDDWTVCEITNMIGRDGENGRSRWDHLHRRQTFREQVDHC